MSWQTFFFPVQMHQKHYVLKYAHCHFKFQFLFYEFADMLLVFLHTKYEPNSALH